MKGHPQRIRVHLNPAKEDDKKTRASLDIGCGCVRRTYRGKHHYFPDTLYVSCFRAFCRYLSFKIEFLHVAEREKESEMMRDININILYCGTFVSRLFISFSRISCFLLPRLSNKYNRQYVSIENFYLLLHRDCHDSI